MPEQQSYLRFSQTRRIEHWTLVGSFAVLTATGIPQKFSQFRVSEWLLWLMGGLEVARILHRVAAVVLVLLTIYHFGTLIYYWYVERGSPHILPELSDARNAWEQVRFNLGISKEKPRQGLFTFEEKFEYWALIWGTFVMVLTGFFLWNPITATQFLSGEWIPAAKAAHGGEALLAVLSIILWHFYHVLIKHQNKSMFTGYLSAHEMAEEHPLALENQDYVAPTIETTDEEYLARRRKFAYGYGGAAFLLVLGVVWFVSVEQTAVAQPSVIPDLGRASGFTPLTPTPFPTLAAARFDAEKIGTTWENGIGDMFAASCGLCHQGQGSPGNLDLLTYSGALAGGDSGLAVVPNASGISLAVIWPQRQEHPGRLSPDQLNALRDWIEAGAPER
ncbi:MAG: cytochrome b/b6 domain-containing protein [Chloroflexi bacterium]|nr:cytochrome b/b6 domain-containing protein [Chloroflexota bacterium]